MNDLEKKNLQHLSQLSEESDSSVVNKARFNVDTVLADPYQLDVRQKFAVKYDAEYVGGFHEGRAYVKKDGKYFFIDESGERINDQEYDVVKNFSEGLACVSIEQELTEEEEEELIINNGAGEQLGILKYINKQGEVVIKGPFMYAEPFKNGYAEVEYGFDTGCSSCIGPAVIDRTGSKVLDYGQNGYHYYIRLPNPESDRLSDNFIFADAKDLFSGNSPYGLFNLVDNPNLSSGRWGDSSACPEEEPYQVYSRVNTKFNENDLLEVQLDNGNWCFIDEHGNRVGSELTFNLRSGI